jgi:hypothetical protein
VAELACEPIRIDAYVVQLTFREKALSAAHIQLSCLSCSLLLNAKRNPRPTQN